jgi:hypothetical protein
MFLTRKPVGEKEVSDSQVMGKGVLMPAHDEVMCFLY